LSRICCNIAANNGINDFVRQGRAAGEKNACDGHPHEKEGEALLFEAAGFLPGKPQGLALRKT